MTKHVLLVEDEQDIASVVKKYLEMSQFQVTHLNNGSDAVAWVKQNQPDLILLDLMLPGVDGLSICKEVRTFSQVPIIMVTAKVEEVDRLIGLEIGADDYVCKPFSVKELVARVKVIFRRLQSPEISHTELTLDEGRLSVLANGQQVELTALEFNMFKLLYDRPGCVFSRHQIMDAMYADFRINSDRTVDSHIRNLRKKINSLSLLENPIRSIYGVGYKYELTTDKSEAVSA